MNATAAQAFQIANDVAPAIAYGRSLSYIVERVITEQQLREKLRKITAVFECAATAGQRQAAAAAMEGAAGVAHHAPNARRVRSASGSLVFARSLLRSRLLRGGLSLQRWIWSLQPAQSFFVIGEHFTSAHGEGDEPSWRREFANFRIRGCCCHC
jgi:hypothetical protein